MMDDIITRNVPIHPIASAYYLRDSRSCRARRYIYSSSRLDVDVDVDRIN